MRDKSNADSCFWYDWKKAWNEYQANAYLAGLNLCLIFLQIEDTPKLGSFYKHDYF